MNRPADPQKLQDPFDLNRFLSAQATAYERALAELRRGSKQSHWMWFIFPQVDGLGSSSTTRFHAIKSLTEAKAYLEHPTLGPRLIECCKALLHLHGRSASEILGYPDDLKLMSSMTLFATASKAELLFSQVLERYFGGRLDQKTLEILHRHRAS